MLISTGAFWTCYACSFAITGQALSVDLGYHPEKMNNGKRRPRWTMQQIRSRHMERSKPWCGRLLISGQSTR